MSAVQPIPAPTTWAEYELIRPQLVDTLGRPLVSAWCDSCQCRHFTVDPCMAEASCPVCGSTRARCVRPSGHEADSWHKDRRDRFEQLRDEMEAAGIPQVARWPLRS